MKARIIQNIALTIGSILFALILCEGILRLSTEPTEVTFLRPNLNVELHPAPAIMPGVKNASIYKTNSLGIRGDELSKKHTNLILALGGSTTECFYLDQEEAWPYLIQKQLNDLGDSSIWVGNAGKSGTNSWHHKKQMEVINTKDGNLPINTCLMLLGINDFLTFLADSTQYLSPSISRIEEKSFSQFQRNSFIKRSRLYQLITPVLKNFNTHSRLVKDNVGNFYSGWRENRQKASRLIEKLPKLEAAIMVYEKNLRSIVELAESKNIQLIWMTQPTIWHDSLSQEIEQLLWMGGVGEYQNSCCQNYYSTEALAIGMNQFNQSLIMISKEKNIPCIDLANALSKDTTTFYDDCHFNESGSRKVADAVLEYLHNNKLYLMNESDK